jgi:hypothetical protein
MILLVAFLWVFPLLFVWLMWQRPSNRSVAAFAKAYAVPLTPHNVEQLRRYIQWTRRWRLGGAVAANLLALAVDVVTQRGGFGWVPLIIGYSVGSLLGELFRPVDRATDTAPIASLERRSVRDFMVPRFVFAAAAVFVASMLPAVFLLLDNPLRSWVDTVDPANVALQRPQDWFVLALVAVSIGAAGVAWLGGRTLAQAPIPADTPDRMAVRHAIRSAAIMSLIGGTVMVSGAVGAKLGSAATMLDGDASKIIQWSMNLTTILCWLSAVWGGLLTLTTIPRVAPFAGPLPTVPESSPRQAA